MHIILYFLLLGNILKLIQTTLLYFFCPHEERLRKVHWVVPPWLVFSAFNMIRKKGKLEAKASLGKRLVSLHLDINFPDDFVAELALLHDIRRLKVGNRVSGRTMPARTHAYCKVRIVHSICTHMHTPTEP